MYYTYDKDGNSYPIRIIDSNTDYSTYPTRLKIDLSDYLHCENGADYRIGNNICLVCPTVPTGHTFAESPVKKSVDYEYFPFNTGYVIAPSINNFQYLVYANIILGGLKIKIESEFSGNNVDEDNKNYTTCNLTIENTTDVEIRILRASTQQDGNVENWKYKTRKNGDTLFIDSPYVDTQTIKPHTTLTGWIKARFYKVGGGYYKSGKNSFFEFIPEFAYQDENRRKNFRKIEINHEKTVITTDEEWLSDTTLTYTGKDTMNVSTNFFTEEK